MKTNELIERLRNIVPHCWSKIRKKLDDIADEIADTLETQQKRIAELEAELKDERHRHDRYVDFELAQAKELERVKAERAKPLTAFLAQIDAYKGLKRKFLVFKSDTGEMVENCFVLRPDKDPAAAEALRAYARATDNATLSADILNWVGEGEEHRWIPVTERLPDLIPCDAGTAYSEAVIVWTSGRKAMIAVWDGIDFRCAADYWEAWGEDITHWMPLPEPPKEG